MTTTTKTTLTDRNNIPIGFLETTGTMTKILDRNCIPLGTYDSKTDWTLILTGQPVGRGNLLVSLLPPQRR